ncbi:MAG TPA: hypothetical protein VKB12_02600 [Pyrinomonadaceae bacterium]|nr:hypothetical protein [Pyrinomonadaceae bacterium]
MRWKLLIAASLLAFAVGTGACVFVVRLLAAGGGGALSAWAALVALALPVACVVYASIFVYRHTARRRALQAAATALLASMLTLAALLLGSLLTNVRAPELLQPAPTNARRS